VRVLLATLALLFLTACSQIATLNYQPVILNDENDIAALKLRLNATTNARELAFEVMQVTNYRCDQFFESLDRMRSDADFAIARVAALSTGLPNLLRAAHASASAIGNVAAALGFVTGTINDVKQYYLLADFKPEIYKKWQVFRSKQQDEIEGKINPATTIAEAKLYLYEYVRMCLPSQLKQWLYESANSGVGHFASTAGQGGGGTGRARSAAPARAGRPGPIVID
jgi:hypothetical protein